MLGDPGTKARVSPSVLRIKPADCSSYVPSARPIHNAQQAASLTPYVRKSCTNPTPWRNGKAFDARDRRFVDIFGRAPPIKRHRGLANGYKYFLALFWGNID